MQLLEINTQGGDSMSEESIHYFLIGLKSGINKLGMTQKEFSEGVTTKENLSKILNKKVGTTPDMRESLAKRAGKEVSEIVLLGKQSENNSIEGEHLLVVHAPERRDPVSSMTELIKTFRKQEDSISFWRSAMEGIPFAICIVDHENTVVFQNQADRSLYKMNIVGEHLCPACRDSCEIPHPCEDCAVAKVFEVGEKVVKVANIRGETYRIIANPITTVKGGYVVVITIPIDEFTK